MLERKAFYSPQEVAELAGLSTSTILNYIRSGKVYAIKLSERVYRIPLGSVIATFYPELKRPPKYVKRTGDVEATWRRWMKESHAAFDEAVRARRAPRAPKRKSRTPKRTARPRATAARA